MNADRVALITGGTRGIGFGIAHRLALDGIHLVLNGRRPEPEVAACLHSLRHLGVRVEYCRADISLNDDRETLVESVRNKFGALHILVNNAGIAPKMRADILDATEQSFEAILIPALEMQ